MLLLRGRGSLNSNEVDLAILIGIDEAGYGPILGPLAVSAVGLRLGDERLGQSLWEVLRGSVCKTEKGSHGRVAIHDSKKLHKPGKGYGLLQRGVLSCLGALDQTGDGTLPKTVGELLGATYGLPDGELARYPWYAGFEQQALEYDADDVRVAGHVLREDLQRQQMALCRMRARVLPVGMYNEQVSKAKNKALVLLGGVLGHVDEAVSSYGDAENKLQIVVDRLGGRTQYREALQRVYPQMSLRILKEAEGVSSYQLVDAGWAFKIHFLTKGDDAQLPIALASMISKYLRELFMERLNRYFIERHPDLKPTAGYYKDGRRFLDDLQARGERDMPLNNLLVRQR